jgi:hypothetical protein
MPDHTDENAECAETKTIGSKTLYADQRDDAWLPSVIDGDEWRISIADVEMKSQRRHYSIDIAYFT